MGIYSIVVYVYMEERMKKISKIITASLLVAGLAACGSNSVSNIVNNESSSSSSSSSNVIYAEDGYGEGELGDTLGTAWFTFRVNDAYLADEYKGQVTPDDGETLLVVNVTLENTFGENIIMFDVDFQTQWGGEGDDDYRMPVTLYDDSLQIDGMLEGEYTLAAGETRSGDLVFSVPTGYDVFSLSFMEYFENEETGDTFFVFFPVD